MRAACLPVLTPAMYFTFSRGAWIALVVGAIAAVAIDPRRLQLLAVSLAIAPFSVIAVWLATRADGLRIVGSSLDAGNRGRPRAALARAGPGCRLGARGGRHGLRRAQTRGTGRGSHRVRRSRARSGRRARVGRVDGVGIARRYRRSRLGGLSRSRRPGGGEDLGERLFDFSANGRVETWRVAWDEWEANRVIGTGAGTYWQSWAADRPIGLEVQDAHSLYIETLGELGVVGLALLLLALLVPVVAAVRTRATAVVPAAFGGYVAWLAHAGVDWDWELLGVTLPALLVGVALVAAARRDERSASDAALAHPGRRHRVDGSGRLRCAGLRTARLRPRRARRRPRERSSGRRALREAVCPLGLRAVAGPGRRPGRGRIKSQRGMRIAKPSSATARTGSCGSPSARSRRARSSGEALARAAELNPRSPEIRELQEVIASSG